MSNEYEQQGPAYHWKTELYKRLNLPVYDGVEEELEKQNKKRKKALDIFKSEKTMRRRVALKSLRVQEAQERILWTKQHGQDTYGGSSEIIQGEKKVGTKPVKRLCTKCGSNTHSLPTHHSCPYNSKKMHSTKSSTKDADTASDSDTDKGGIPPENTDSHSDYDDDEPTDGDIDTPDRLNWGTKKTNPRAKEERRPVSRSLGQETTCQCTRDIFRGNTFCVG